jgi:hypothetical protein
VSTQTLEARVPITAAGIRLGLSYWAVRDRVMRGELKGGKDSFGRLYVEADSLEDALRNRERAMRARR